MRALLHKAHTCSHAHWHPRLLYLLAHDVLFPGRFHAWPFSFVTWYGLELALQRLVPLRTLQRLWRAAQDTLSPLHTARATDTLRDACRGDEDAPDSRGSGSDANALGAASRWAPSRRGWRGGGPEVWLASLAAAQKLQDVHLDLPMALPSHWHALTCALAALPEIGALAVHDAALSLALLPGDLLALTRLAGKLQELDLSFVRHTLMGRSWVGAAAAHEKVFAGLKDAFVAHGGEVHCSLKQHGSGGHGNAGGGADGGDGGGGGGGGGGAGIGPQPMQQAAVAAMAAVAVAMAGGNAAAMGGNAAPMEGDDGDAGAGDGENGGGPIPLQDEADGEQWGGASVDRKGKAEGEDTDELLSIRSPRSWMFMGMTGVLAIATVRVWIWAGCRVVTAARVGLAA